MTKTATAARKFREDKKEIIRRLRVTINAIKDADTLPEIEEFLLLHNLAVRGSDRRSDTLAEKLAGTVMDYVYSI